MSTESEPIPDYLIKQLLQVVKKSAGGVELFDFSKYFNDSPHQLFGAKGPGKRRRIQHRIDKIKASKKTSCQKYIDQLKKYNVNPGTETLFTLQQEAASERGRVLTELQACRQANNSVLAQLQQANPPPKVTSMKTNDEDNESHNDESYIYNAEDEHAVESYTVNKDDDDLVESVDCMLLGYRATSPPPAATRASGVARMPSSSSLRGDHFMSTPNRPVKATTRVFSPRPYSRRQQRRTVPIDANDQYLVAPPRPPRVI